MVGTFNSFQLHLVLTIYSTKCTAIALTDVFSDIFSVFLYFSVQVSVGEEMESDRYLVQVECVRPDQNNAAPEQTPGSGQVSGLVGKSFGCMEIDIGHKKFQYRAISGWGGGGGGG